MAAILVISIICVVVIDMELSNVSDIISDSLSSDSGLIAFTLIIIIYSVAQYLLIRYVKDKSSEIRIKQDVFHSVNRIVKLAPTEIGFITELGGDEDTSAFDESIAVVSSLERVNKCSVK